MLRLKVGLHWLHMLELKKMAQWGSMEEEVHSPSTLSSVPSEQARQNRLLQAAQLGAQVRTGPNSSNQIRIILIIIVAIVSRKPITDSKWKNLYWKGISHLGTLCRCHAWLFFFFKRMKSLYYYFVIFIVKTNSERSLNDFFISLVYNFYAASRLYFYTWISLSFFY